MITTKTVFINKKFQKFHNKHILEKIENRKKWLLPSSKYSKLIIYKYNKYIFDAPVDTSKKVFCFMFGYDESSGFLKNFDISEYQSEENLENVQNTDLDIYINKRQISFFKFLIDSFETLYFLQNRFIEQATEAMKKELTKRYTKVLKNETV